MKKNKKAIPYGIDQMPWWRSRRLACGIKAISFPYTYKHRVVVGNTASEMRRGCDGVNPRRVIGRVNLSDGWMLSTNKTDLGDIADDLYDAVAKVAEPFLERSRSESESIDLLELENAFNDALGFGELTGVPDINGSPKGRSGRKRSGQRVSGNGSQRGRKKGGRLKIDFAPLPDDDFIDVDIGDNGPPTVIANSNHPFVARYRESADKTLFLSNLMTAFIYEVNRHNCQHSLFDAVNGCPQKRLATALTRIAEPVAAS